MGFWGSLHAVLTHLTLSHTLMLQTISSHGSVTSLPNHIPTPPPPNPHLVHPPCLDVPALPYSELLLLVILLRDAAAVRFFARVAHCQRAGEDEVGGFAAVVVRGVVGVAVVVVRVVSRVCEREGHVGRDVRGVGPGVDCGVAPGADLGFCLCLCFLFVAGGGHGCGLSVESKSGGAASHACCQTCLVSSPDGRGSIPSPVPSRSGAARALPPRPGRDWPGLTWTLSDVVPVPPTTARGSTINKAQRGLADVTERVACRRSQHETEAHCTASVCLVRARSAHSPMTRVCGCQGEAAGC